MLDNAVFFTSKAQCVPAPSKQDVRMLGFAQISIVPWSHPPLFVDPRLMGAGELREHKTL